MRKIFLNFFLSVALLAVLLFLLSCAKKERQNPLDPNSANFTPPTFSLNAGSVKSGDTLNSDTASLNWSAVGPGSLEYSLQIDGDGFSSWSTNQTAIFSGLDEGAHEVTIRYRYIGWTQAEESTVFFTVNSVANPGLYFFPKLLEMQTGDSTAGVLLKAKGLPDSILSLNVVFKKLPVDVVLDSVINKIPAGNVNYLRGGDTVISIITFDATFFDGSLTETAPLCSLIFIAPPGTSVVEIKTFQISLRVNAAVFDTTWDIDGFREITFIR